MADLDPRQELFMKSVLFQRAYESFAIYAAHDLGIFREIPASGATSRQIAATLGLTQTSVELLMNCLVTAGILEKNGELYIINPRFQEPLSPGNREVREMLDVCRDQCRLWFDAAENIRSRNETQDILVRFQRGAAWTGQYLQRVEAKNRPHAHALVERLAPEIMQARKVLDLGGGHGYYAKLLLALNPDLQITIYDLQGAIDYCYAQQDPALSRVCFITGDARSLNLEAVFDLAIVSDLLHYFVDSEKKETLRRTLASLAPGGLLVISKFRLNAAGAEPRFSAFFALQKHLENPNGGYLETDERTAGMLREAGAEQIEIVVLNEEKSLVLGRRPR